MKTFAIISILLLWSIQAFSQEQKDTSQVNLPPVTVTAYRENQPVGEYKQPEWTTHRRFPTTRVYIQVQPGEAEFEQWVEVREEKTSAGGGKKARISQELEFGLGAHTQFDIYMNNIRYWDGQSSSFNSRGWAVELRYAFADWNALPGNPTLYFEYSTFDATNGDEDQGYDKIEPKLLLGGEMGNRWHWGVNIVTERGLAPADYRDEEYVVNAAASYLAADELFSIGPAFQYKYEIGRASGSPDWRTHWLLGPSIQYRPVKRAFLDVEPLFGITDQSRMLDMTMIFGWTF